MPAEETDDGSRRRLSQSDAEEEDDDAVVVAVVGVRLLICCTCAWNISSSGEQCVVPEMSHVWMLKEQLSIQRDIHA